MPARNSRKEYREDSPHHLYNRGVEKRLIFLDDQDRNVFRKYLAEYLLPKDTEGLQRLLADPTVPWTQKDDALKLLRLNNFFGDIELLSYALMPNHFHFLVWQKTPDAIDRFMNSLCTRYSGFFNKKYKRVGSLFQGVYKGVLIETDEQLIHTHRYIHRNPCPCLQGLALQNLYEYPWSSYRDYLGLRKTPWIALSRLNGLLPKRKKDYISFIEQLDGDETGKFALKGLSIDDEW